MKRSEILQKIIEEIELMRGNENGYYVYPPDDQISNRILKVIEEADMLPPTIKGEYDNVPTVTPTGNLDYSFRRGWEKE